MYIRWKRYARQQDTILVAHLASSRRIAGQPRQQVRYLASIRVAWQHHPAHRQVFWERADARLAPLPLSPAQRCILEQQLASQVPRPTPRDFREIATLRTQLDELAGQVQSHPPV